MDILNKFAQFIPLSHPYDAKKLAQIHMSQIYKVHELSRVIVSDRDPVFTSVFWKELFKLSKVKLNYSFAYHP